METNKILSANLLDILFDGRNKDYGAYELRKTYQKRITKALFITTSISLLIFAGSVLGKSLKQEDRNRVILTEINLSSIPDEKEPEPFPKQEKKPEQQQVKTIALTPPEIKDDKNVQKPPPSQDDLVNAKIDIVTKDGRDDDGLVDGNVPGDDKGVIEKKRNDESNEPWSGPVEIEAKFVGNWKKFLERNLNANIPDDNAAPAGNYPIDVQFVVDTNGIVSDIKPLTNLGYGMEQEAVRVLKKATKWEPAIQNGRKVKAYRRQRIIFQVLGNE